jgi:hypothetical protein
MSHPAYAGARPRACLFAVFAVAAAMVVANARMARGQEGQIFPCGPASGLADRAKAMGNAPFVALTPEQFQFARGLFVMAPDTPASLPPGDSAAMSLGPDGSASIVYIDGDQACAPMKLGKEGVDVIMQVGRGEIVHSGKGL